MANEYVVVVSVDASGAVTGSRVFNRSMAEMAAAAEKTQGKVGLFGKAVNMLPPALRQFVNPATAVAAGIAAVGAAMVSAVQKAAAFESSMARVRTLTGKSAEESAGLTEEMKRLAVQFGSSAPSQAAALYEVISAGIEDTAQATKILTVANKLAIGGITDVKTAADGLTSVLSSYQISADQATRVSDLFFISAAAGKTTIEELSATIGNVAPIAAGAGVKIEEVLAAVGALTKGGLDTARSMTGLRQAILNIVKPTTQAAELAARLGLDFSAAALESKGLKGVLEEVMVATKGDIELMGRLFTSVEGFTAVSALATSGADDFAESLRKMGGAGGQTEEAFATMNETFEQQFKIFSEQINVALINLGTRILPVLNAALKQLNAYLGDIHASTFATTYEELEEGVTGAYEQFMKLNEVYGEHARLTGVSNEALEAARENWMAWEEAMQAKIRADTEAANASNAVAKAAKAAAVEAGVGATLTEEQGKAWEDLKKTLLPINALVVEYQTQLNLLNLAQKTGAMTAPEYELALHNLQEAYRGAVMGASGATKALDTLNDKQAELKKQQMDWNKKLMDTLHSINPVAEAADAYNTKISHMVELLVAGRISQDQFNTAVDAAKVVMVEAGKKGEESAGVVETEWTRATENMVDGLAEFFMSGLQGFDDFAESVMDTIKKMVSNILAAILQSGIQGSIAKMANGVGGTGVMGKMFGGFGGKGADPTAMMMGGGAAGGGGMMSALGAVPIAGWIAMGMMVNDSLFKDGWSPGKTDMTTVGKLSPDVMFDKLLRGIGLSDRTASLLSGSAITSKLFGRKAAEQVGGSLDLGFAGGAVNGRTITDMLAKGGVFRSDKRTSVTGNIDQELADQMRDVFDDGVKGFRATIEKLGGTAANDFTGSRAKIDTFGKTPEEIQEQIDEFLRKSVLEGISHLVVRSEGLSSAFRKVVLSFEQDSEDFVKAFELMSRFELARQLDPLVSGAKAFADSQKTLTQRVKDQLDAVMELSAGYDQSLESLEGISNGFVLAKNAMSDLVMQLEAVKRSTAEMFQGTAQSIRESLLNEEELYALRRTQFDDLVAQVANTTDPGELARLSERANQALSDAFGLLDETQTPELAQGFLDALASLESLVGDRADLGLQDVAKQTVALDDQVTKDLLNASSQQMAAAEIMREAAEIMLSASTNGSAGGVSFPTSTELGL